MDHGSHEVLNLRMRIFYEIHDMIPGVEKNAGIWNHIVLNQQIMGRLYADDIMTLALPELLYLRQIVLQRGPARTKDDCSVSLGTLDNIPVHKGGEVVDVGECAQGDGTIIFCY